MSNSLREVIAPVLHGWSGQGDFTHFTDEGDQRFFYEGAEAVLVALRAVLQDNPRLIIELGAREAAWLEAEDGWAAFRALNVRLVAALRDVCFVLDGVVKKDWYPPTEEEVQALVTARALLADQEPQP